MRNSKYRQAIWLTVMSIVLVTTGISYAHPEWPMEIGVDFWNYSAIKQKLAKSLMDHQRLDQVQKAVLKRIDLREQIVANLFAGSTSLAEAAAGFQLLNASDPKLSSSIRYWFPARNEEESTCLQLLCFAETSVRNGRQSQVKLDRLRQEFAKLQQSGEIHLPKVTFIDDE